MDFFASCPKGIESLLAEELTGFGASSVKETVAGCYFRGSLSVSYQACLWSRLANRILLMVARFPAGNREVIYEGIQTVDWDDHIDPDRTLAVTFTGSSLEIRNTHFGALLVKDAVVDQLLVRTGKRPSIATKSPDLRIHVRLHKGTVQVSIDLSGESLHRRGYRQDVGKAPLKENLAAAILYRCGWRELANDGGSLVDPMCGSGTFLMEGAMIAADIAPGLLRTQFGFDRWPGHDQSIWRDAMGNAHERRRIGLDAMTHVFQGYEADPWIVRQGLANAERAGLSKCINITQAELASLNHIDCREGLVVVNPPYGERLGDEASLVYLYQKLGETFRTTFKGWQGAVFTGNPGLGRRMGIRSRKQYTLFNGALECKLLTFVNEDQWFVGYDARGRAASVQATRESVPLTSGATMFANRLRKNLKLMGKWARCHDVQCYRLYDADMPEYSVAVDLYGDKVHVQEYKAPSSIDEIKAAERLQDVMSVLPEVLSVSPADIALKSRARQSGNKQYERQSDRNEFFEVREGDARFLINLHDYLDTGLFLDHRLLRLRMAREAADKRFLNLFCYTGAATVHVALGGARSTTSVDLSKTYLDWARKNLLLNGFSDRHHLHQADGLRWLAEAKAQYDLIYIDPPTFSNSKRMNEVFDVQRDHVELLRLAMKRLAHGGTLYFSNNYRRFKLDECLSDEFDIADITGETLDKDFERHRRIHQCWVIWHKR
ncbi:MAG: bifunctional 23S rRNA (guanine(2069)-N(7))-methyltransferase RlmK/23S rRNA (guanine(2445)-N(2))-methyltransferase RlmL [Endozoicomonadaceae bacterium]|nr:bifunctional 23S rRNA (guanine(2069)-N(7))-methyltransferase RlmK/23S rRNA (guanine(2445)-N(2))-methyltransferase RlmL [Endozoicomonadaceae bacterium]